MDPKYILSIGGDDQRGVVTLLDRPTAEQIKAQCGVGLHTLYRMDGTAVKHYTVSVNRNGNLKCELSTPTGLVGISTLNLNRLIKYYERIVKIWPEQGAAVRKVQAQLMRREDLLVLAGVSIPVNGCGSIKYGGVPA